MNFNKLYIFIFFNIFISTGNAQVSLESWMESKTVVQDNNENRTYLDALLAAQARWPWVDKFEIRTETERLQTQRQEFLFRTSFLGFSGKKFEFLKHHAYILKEDKIIQKEEYKNLFDRVLSAVEILNTQSILNEKITARDYHKSLDSIYLLQMSAGLRIDVYDFLKNREEWLELRQSLQEDSIILSKAILSVGLIGHTIDLSNMITPDAMQQKLINLDVQQTGHPLLSDMVSEIMFLESDYKAEKAKENKILDFAQLRYTVREDLLFENRFSVGVGLAIPWNGSSKLKYQEIKLKQTEANWKLKTEKTDLEQQLDRQKNVFALAFETYRMYQTMEEDPAWTAVKEKVSIAGLLKPEEILTLKKFELKRNEKITKLYYTMLQAYLEAMYLSGSLQPGFRMVTTAK